MLLYGGRVALTRLETAVSQALFNTVSGRTTDMADAYKAVLVPEHHRDAVEKYVRDLEELDELRASERAELRN